MSDTPAPSTEGKLQELVAQVAAAYFSSTHVPVSDIPTVIGQIAASLSAVGPVARVASAEGAAGAKPSPAQIRKSITPDALVSFEDGKRYKTLRRHLTTHGLTPEQYREKWSLPADYPMVAPSYSAARSAMAKSFGLGQLGRAGRGRGAAKAAPKRGRGAKAG